MLQMTEVTLTEPRDDGIRIWRYVAEDGSTIDTEAAGLAEARQKIQNYLDNLEPGEIE